MTDDLLDDPAVLLTRVRAAADGFVYAAAALTDDQVAAPSALPGWSRGHVLTHVARSADVYRWLLALARTGVEPGPRADGASLERALREGAGRPAAEIADDLRGSLDAMLEEAARMPADRWPTLVTALAGWRHPAWFVLHRARRELETHHVDLAVGRVPADWPEDYVRWALDGTLAALAARDFPLASVEATDLGQAGSHDNVWQLAPTGVRITAPAHAVLAWLTGRAAGQQLPPSDGPLPTPPPWPLPPVPGWD